MVTINVLNIDGKAILPIHGDGNPESLAAGYDVVAVDDPIVVGEIGRELTLNDGTKVSLYKNVSYLEYHTALKVAPMADHMGDYYFLDARARSSVRKYNLVLANSVGTIDNDYRGEILVSFKYIFQPSDFVIEFDPTEDGKFKPQGLLAGIDWSKVYRKGDKIAQLIAQKTNPCNYVFVSELTQTTRAEGGHGSTGQSVPTSSQGGGKMLVDRYIQTEGVQTRKRYSDEIKERERIEGAPRAGTVMPKPGISERK